MTSRSNRAHRGKAHHGKKRHHKKKSKTRRLTDAAFREVSENEPGIVEHTREKFGEERAEAQKTAIALSKARRAGARIPKK